MRNRHRLPSLAGAVLLSLTGAALAQGHGTPNAPEAGPASPGAESHSSGKDSKEAPKPDAQPQGAAGTDADRKESDPKR